MDFNRITLLGRVGTKPEIRAMDNGRTMLRMRVATSHRWRDAGDDWQEETDWHSVVAFGPLADRLEGKLGKGDLVFVDGRMRVRTYKAADGQPRVSSEIRARTIKGLPGRDLAKTRGQDDASADIPF